MEILPKLKRWTGKKLMACVLEDYVHKHLHNSKSLYSRDDLKKAYDSLSDDEHIEFSRLSVLPDIIGDLVERQILAETMTVKNINMMEIQLDAVDVYSEVNTEKSKKALKQILKGLTWIFSMPYDQCFDAISNLYRINLFYDFISKEFKGCEVDKLKYDMSLYEPELKSVQETIEKLREKLPEDTDDIKSFKNFLYSLDIKRKPYDKLAKGTEAKLKKILNNDTVQRADVLGAVYKQDKD